MEKITLKTLHLATAQQVFNQVKEHLLTQNKKSLNPKTEICLYRYNIGLSCLSCAGGCLIADNEYNVRMDKKGKKMGTDWDSLIKRGLVPTTSHNQLISSLQRVHDAYKPEEWESKLKLVAELYNLNY